MKRGYLQNCSVPLTPMPAKPRRNYPGLSKKLSLVMEMDQTYVSKLFVEEGMKLVEIIDRLNQHYGQGASRLTPVYSWIKEVKSWRKNLLNIPPPGRVRDEALDGCIGKALKENPHLSTKNIATALNISAMTARNHLTKSLSMRSHHIR
jgi:hypothetical protein